MEQYLKFFERYQSDKQAYWNVDTINQDNRIEVIWIGKNIWQLKKVADTFWFETDTSNIINKLEELQADTYEFEAQLRKKIIEMIVAAHHLCNAGRELLGSDYVDERIEEYDNFFKQLVNTVNQIMKEKKKEKFTVIDGGERK